jgi:hypothetical protein
MIASLHENTTVPGVGAMKDDRPGTKDYSSLSNDELYEMLCGVLPHMCHFSVNDLTRETVIAMLKVTGLIDFV